MRLRPAHVLPVLLALAAGPAEAGTFDAATGKLTLDPEAVAWDCDGADTADSRLQPVFMGASGNEVPVQPERFLFEEESLQGLGALAFGGDLPQVLFDLRGLEQAFAGRRVEIRFWQQAAGTQAQGSVSWYSGDLDAAMQSSNWYALHGMGDLVFLPTGRATDDGWREVSTGPFDFMLGGRLPATFMTISDPHADGSRWDPSIRYDGSLRVHVDAIEVLDLGPAKVPDAACRLPQEAEICGEGAVCVYGRCVDAAPVVGPAFPSDEVRRDYLARRTFEFGIFDGSRRAAEMHPALVEVVDGLQDLSDPARIWPALEKGVEALEDGHASAPAVPWLMAPDAGVCLALGEADLLPEAGLAPLVFSVNSRSPVGAQLLPGDVLTAIDGLPVTDWRPLARRHLDYSGDPRAREVITTAQLLSAAMATGSVVTFTRCPSLGVDGTGCGGELQTIEIDLASFGGEPLWAGAPPPGHYSSGPCDYRFRRIPEVDDPTGYETAKSTVQDGITWLLFNGFPSISYGSGAAWDQTFRDAFRYAPERVVIDERTGYGGTADAMTVSSSYFLPVTEFDRMELAPQADFPYDETLVSSLRSCVSSSYEFIPCGYYSIWRMQDYFNQYEGVLGQSRVAVLITSDVSGNDFFTQLLRFRTGPTRVFGPTVTWGAFGPIVSLPAHIGESSSGSFQIQDTAFFGPGAAEAPWLTGSGVEPDEVVHQTQSDILRGIDTLVTAARTWVLQ